MKRDEQGVRVQCPDCGFNVVMKSEQDVPVGITKIVEGVPYCPNHDGGVPMKPVASVPETETRATPGVPGQPISLEDRLAKIREGQHDVDEAAKVVERLSAQLKDARNVHAGRVTTLGVLINRLTAVGPDEARGPLLDLADQPDADGLSAIDQSARLQHDELRLALAKRCHVVTVEEIAGWSLEQYDAVITYLAVLEANRDVAGFSATGPDFLGGVGADRVFLHGQLGEQRMELSLADVCALTPEEAEAARVYVTQGGDRPACLPAPGIERQRTISRRGRRGRTADPDVRAAEPVDAEPDTDTPTDQPSL